MQRRIRSCLLHEFLGFGSRVQAEGLGGERSLRVLPQLQCGVRVLGSECYGRGSDSKPACQVLECEEKHAEKLHEMLAGLDANVNPVAEEEDEEEEDAYVNMARADEREEEENDCWDTDYSWLEMEAEEEIEDKVFYVNTLTREEDDEEEEAEEDGQHDQG